MEIKRDATDKAFSDAIREAANYVCCGAGLMRPQIDTCLDWQPPENRPVPYVRDNGDHTHSETKRSELLILEVEILDLLAGGKTTKVVHVEGCFCWDKDWYDSPTFVEYRGYDDREDACKPIRWAYAPIYNYI